ncbi:MAG: Gfo/Idh/MocA family protein [Spirochaetaceae bacterium]
MKTVRCAIIGCGGYAGAHARRLSARDDVQIVALASRTASSIERLIERRLSDYTPAPTQYTSWETLLEREKPDAVVLSTPHHLHFEQAVRAMDAGCHVLIEKPMAVSLDEAKLIHERANQLRGSGRSLKVGVCYNPAFSPAMERVRSAVASGSHGRLELVTGYLSQNWQALTAGSWRQTPKDSGGGQTMDSGSHMIHSLLSGVGARAREVFAYSDNRGSDVDINTVVSVRFENGVLANLTIGGNSAVDGSHTSFIFTDGRIDVDAWKGEWVRSYRSDGEPEVLENLGEPSPDDNFIDAILNKADLVVTDTDGLHVAAFTQTLYRSIESGKPEQVVYPEGA